MVVRLAPMLNHTRRRVVLSGIVRLVAARAVLLPRAAKHRAGVREVHAEALERVEEGVEVGVGGCVDFGGEEALEGGAVFIAKEVLEDVARCRGGISLSGSSGRLARAGHCNAEDGGGGGGGLKLGWKKVIKTPVS